MLDKNCNFIIREKIQQFAKTKSQNFRKKLFKNSSFVSFFKACQDACRLLFLQFLTKSNYTLQSEVNGLDFRTEHVIINDQSLKRHF